ncbi:MAG: hypothetical protein M1839_000640 [Geoglossum umbratile]|nr:MAG: hypothetical protein M1839_000640 [Geoglossum umbratile]
MSITSTPLKLEPYVRVPPKDSLVLLTSVLGASTNWLVLRFLYNALIASSTIKPPTSAEGDGSDNNGYTVLLASFLRDKSFWVEGARRIGLDLGKEERRGKWRFVDGLALGGEGAVKRELGPGSRTVTATATATGQGRRTVVIVDAVDWLVVERQNMGGVGGVDEWVGEVMGMPSTHATILTLSADPPLLSPSPTTPLETAHTALLTSLAQIADYVVSLRLLDSGVARDVSGVLRVTNGGGRGREETGVEEGEFLYWVSGDGGVRVWER